MEKLSDERLREIREGCEGVTPGPWIICSGSDEWTDGIDGSDGEAVVWPSEVSTEPETGFKRRQDAEHVARLDPQTVSALVDELLALRKASQWQPIETAPKDEEILLGSFYDSGKWDQSIGQWAVWKKEWPPLGQFRATHWRQLPQPPLKDTLT